MAFAKPDNFRSVLLDIDNELHAEDLESLKFLCLPSISKKGRISKVTTGHELFELLENSRLISESNITFLLNLLSIIGRKDLCCLLEQNIEVDIVNGKSQYCYSNLFFETLYRVSEEMGPDDVESLRFLLKCVPKRKQITSGLDLFSALLELNMIGPSNLDCLCKGFSQMGRKDLVDMLLDFKNKFAKQEPHFVSLSKFPPTAFQEISNEICHPSDEESKATTYYSDSLIDRMQSCNLFEKEIGLSFNGIENSLETTSCKGDKSKDTTQYFDPVTLESFVLPPAKSSVPLLPRYKMDANPRGVCLVIDNGQFTYDPNDRKAKELRERKGSDKDSEKIHQCFTSLNFEVVVETNLSDTAMLECFRRHSRDVERNKRHDCFATFVLSHGDMENGSAYVYGSNGRKVFLNEITKMFRADVCPSLRGKPKLVFLACCLGTSYSRAVPRSLQMSETEARIQSDSSETREEESRSFFCNDQDFLIGYSTVQGHVSFRDTQQGTWYITELTRILSEYHERESLQHMLVLINDSVSKYHLTCENQNGEVGQYTQVPAPQHTLTKQLWL